MKLFKKKKPDTAVIQELDEKLDQFRVELADARKRHRALNQKQRLSREGSQVKKQITRLEGYITAIKDAKNILRS